LYFAFSSRDHFVYVATNTCYRGNRELMHRTQYDRLSQQQLGFLLKVLLVAKGILLTLEV